MLVITEARRLLLLLPFPPEQVHYGCGLEIFLACELVAKASEKCRANGPIECHAGRGRIWNGQQIYAADHWVWRRLNDGRSTPFGDASRTWMGSGTLDILVAVQG